MKKTLKIIVLVICIILSIVYFLKFDIIYLNDNSYTITYVSPIGYRPGSSTTADLYKQLVEIYGDENTEIEIFNGIYNNENISIYDNYSYTFEYLGKSLNGRHFLSCTVQTIRKVISNDTNTIIDEKIRISKYIGTDEDNHNNGRRAKLLLETLKEDYLDGDTYFY